MNTMLGTHSQSRVDNKRLPAMKRDRQIVCETTELERWENEGGCLPHSTTDFTERCRYRFVVGSAAHVD